MMQCKVKGCTEKATRKHMCNKHYYRIYRNGTLKLMPLGKPKQEPRYCSVDGCNKLHYAKGLCNNHYMAERNKKKKCAV